MFNFMYLPKYTNNIIQGLMRRKKPEQISFMTYSSDELATKNRQTKPMDCELIFHVKSLSILLKCIELRLTLQLGRIYF